MSSAHFSEDRLSERTRTTNICDFPRFRYENSGLCSITTGVKQGGEEKAPRTTVQSDLGIWRTRRQRHDIFRKLTLHKVGNSKDDGSYRTISPSESERSRLFPASDFPSPTTQPADDTILGEYADYCIEISGHQNDGRLSVAHLPDPRQHAFIRKRELHAGEFPDDNCLESLSPRSGSDTACRREKRSNWPQRNVRRAKPRTTAIQCLPKKGAACCDEMSGQQDDDKRLSATDILSFNLTNKIL